MTFWSLPALVLVGVAFGPHGLKLLTFPFLDLLDPIVAMTLAMIGVVVGLSAPRLSAAAVMCATAGPLIVAFAHSTVASAVVVMMATIAIAALVAVAAWLLIAQTDSDGEQQVFVVGALLLIGGTAGYLSASALFGGLSAGMIWSVAGDLAKTQIIRTLDYFQHLLVVLLLITAGATMALSSEVLAIAVVIALVHFSFRPITEPFHVSTGLVALALAFDMFRGVAG
jgi:hypothetical protein